MQLLDEMREQLDRGLLPLALYGDPDVYALELERIFNRNWLFAAHESEIPEPGDFVVRNIAEGRWIVSRDDAGTVHVLFDSCRHRGTGVCRADKGNASHFRCPYHGWTYKNDGSLIGVPNREQGYGGAMDTAAWGLLHAPQVAIHRGTIWVNLDPGAPGFLEHLGDFRWYLDTHLGAASGMEVIGDPHRSILKSNWKSGAENFSGDSYHTQTLHRSITELGLFGSLASGSYDVHVTECSGHATSIRRLPPGVDSFWGYPPDVHEDFRRGDLSPTQLDLARSSMVTTGTVFPNLSFIHVNGRFDPDKPPAGYLSFRQWQPRAPGEIEMWSWVMVPKAATPEYKAYAYRVAVASFSPSGNFEQDDTIVWTSIPRSAATLFARNHGAQLNYQMGLPPADAAPVPDWPGPGRVFGSRMEEGVQRTFFNHYLAEMMRP